MCYSPTRPTTKELPTKLPTRPLYILALVVVASVQLVVAQKAQAKKAIDVYRDFQAAAQTAKTIDPLLPFLTKEYRTNLQGAPKASQDNMFRSFQNDATWREIVVTKETIKGNTCQLETTAKDPEGKAMLGKIAFIKQAGEWKIEGQGWVPDFGKK